MELCFFEVVKLDVCGRLVLSNSVTNNDWSPDINATSTVDPYETGNLSGSGISLSWCSNTIKVFCWFSGGPGRSVGHGKSDGPGKLDDLGRLFTCKIIVYLVNTIMLLQVLLHHLLRVRIRHDLIVHKYKDAAIFNETKCIKLKNLNELSLS